ncbi:MAG: dienelactone hydrolase family protein [Cyclobacteriaceae bacterium]
MKTKIITFLVFAAAALAFMSNKREQAKLPADYITKCSSPTQEFAGFATNVSFQKKHQTPLPLQDYMPKGEMVEYKTRDGQTANAYLIKSESKSDDYLFVIHEWWGLNEYVKKESDRLHAELGDINVMALDLYDGKVATTRDEASTYMKSVSDTRAQAIIAGAKFFIGRDTRVFTIGWCFGGGWSLQTGIELGRQAAGTVMFYGMPEQDVERLKTLQCDVLGLFAANEKWITPEVVSQFEKNMDAAGKNLTIKSYAAEHGFANPSNSRFDKEATEDAYSTVMDFIQSRR